MLLVCFSVNFIQMPQTASQHEERKERLKKLGGVVLYC